MPIFNSPRLKFPQGEQRKYIEQVMWKNKIGTKEIASIVGVSPRTIRDWKREIYNITEKAIKRINGSLKSPELKNIKDLTEKWQTIRSDLNRIGGIARYKKYGTFATIEGCRKGGSKTLSILRSKGIIPLCKHFLLPKKQTVELAEFTGILLGDGGITKEQVTITLNSEADKQYVQYVNNLGIKLFGDKPTIAKRKKCKAIDIRFSGKRLVEYLVDKGLVIGNKVKHQVGVPSWIQNSNSYCVACLKGLIDTDGCITTHTYKVNGKWYSYKKLGFANRSIPLIKFVHKTLSSLDLGPKIAGKLETKYVWLYNDKATKKYLEIIGSHNTRILVEGG